MASSLTGKQASSGLDGLPTEAVFSRECRILGVTDCFIFRAVSTCTPAVAVEVLSILGNVVKRPNGCDPKELGRR